MKPYLSNMCSARFPQRTLSSLRLLWLGVSGASLGMVGSWVTAEVDGYLRLREGVAPLWWRELRPEFPPSSVRLLDIERLRICDKLIKFITTQDLSYPRTVSKTLTETPLVLQYIVALASADDKTLSVDGCDMLSSLMSGSSKWIWRNPRSWSPIS